MGEPSTPEPKNSLYPLFHQQVQTHVSFREMFTYHQYSNLDEEYSKLCFGHEGSTCLTKYLRNRLSLSSENQLPIKKNRRSVVTTNMQLQLSTPIQNSITSDILPIDRQVSTTHLSLTGLSAVGINQNYRDD